MATIFGSAREIPSCDVQIQPADEIPSVPLSVTGGIIPKSAAIPPTETDRQESSILAFSLSHFALGPAFLLMSLMIPLTRFVGVVVEIAPNVIMRHCLGAIRPQRLYCGYFFETAASTNSWNS